MNVYDFDGTIFKGDSTAAFYLYSLRRHPLLVRFFPRQAKGLILYVLKKIDKTAFKEYFYSFLKGIDAPSEVTRFWDCSESRIYAWYKAQQQADDVIISASPEFLLKPICTRLGIRHLLASRVDARTGLYSGINCRDHEKVRRFREIFGDAPIDCFYSDSEADLPLARLAAKAFFARRGIIRPWNIRSSKPSEEVII